MDGPHYLVDLGYRGLPSINDNNYQRPLCLLGCHNPLQFLVQIGPFNLKEFGIDNCLAIFRARFKQRSSA